MILRPRTKRWARKWPRRFSLTLVMLLLLTVFGTQALAQGGITLQVREYALDGVGNPTGQDPITVFDFLINQDNTGDPTDPLNLPSTTPMASHSPVVASGDQTNAGATLSALPAGRYLITVRADGFKLGGAHFRVPDDDGGVLVELVQEPLPLSQIRVHAFEDSNPVNGEDDQPRERGLDGFRVFVEDTAGLVIVDWFGNPICAEYDGNGNYIQGTGGECLTDSNGDVIVPNLPRGKYEVLVLPPDGQVNDWVQTTTIEGTKVIDAWIVEGDEGYSPREGFQAAAVWVGFVRPIDNWNDAGVSGAIQGTVQTIVEWTPPVNPLVLGSPVDRPWIAVTDIGGNDQLVHLSRGNPDGSFQINNVPDGTYQLAVWDEPLDYIIAFRTVIISGGNTYDFDALFGGLGVPRWFGWQSGSVFLDIDRDGIREPAGGEINLPGVELLMRFRDGSIRYTTFSEGDGSYEFPEVFELEKFYVSEVGFSHLGFTSALVHDEFVPYDPLNPASYRVIDGALTAANLNWAAKRNVVDWGKYVYDLGSNPPENGGISGIVQYATTRNEFEARLQATEDYEPGIPGVTVRLYALNPNFNPAALPGEPDSDPRGTFLNEVETDQYEHPTAANGNACDVTDSSGAPIADPLNMGPNCIEVPNISNEVREGLFDGGYAFETIFPAGYPNGSEDPIPPGDYVVEVIPPTGYQIVTEEDLNTVDGNDLVPAIPPAGCVGDLTLMNVPDEYNSPYDGQYMPLCDRKAVTVQPGQNKGADFYLMTDNAVPIPGRVYGFLLDDINIETNPNFIYYGEKRGIPNTPVGVRDFTGRLITTVNSDENGIWEVLLPSTYVADCPIPGGVCPNVYKFVGNDPGDPDNPNPNYNPNFQTITFQFDVWPGKTTFADVALFSIVSSVEFPGLQSGQPASCALPASTPQVWSVNPPYGPDGTTVTITGSGFGAAEGSVTLGEDLGAITTFGPGDFTSWTDTEIVFDIFGLNAPQQLLVTTAAGESSQTGITFHKTGAGYNPTVVTVSPPPLTNPVTPVIQPAIDAATGHTLIVAEPGTYYEGINLNRGRIKLQGYGPGAPDGFGTDGTVLDQRFVFAGGGLTATPPAGGPNRFRGGAFSLIDGFRITGARDEQDIGGGIHLDMNARRLQISNNIIQSNGGNFGGGITLGEPYRGDNNNNNIRIHHNRILHNGGISLAGGIGIFNGADNYEIDHNQICGNYSAEYGGGISHFGLSDGGAIHHNEITFNHAFDEGGGVIIAGEQFIPNPLEDPGEIPPITTGSGEVEIYNNLIQSNLSNDDGGGIRLLQPWDWLITISNNMIVNNVSTDMGAGVALDDASLVFMVNNTIARNANTSTAEDSDGLPHAAGVVAEGYSVAFADYLGVTEGFPDPVMFNNAICQNRAYTWDGTQLVLDPSGRLRNFDLEVFSNNPADVFSPAYSLLTNRNDSILNNRQEDFVPDASNANCGNLNALFDTPYLTNLSAVSFRQEPNFITVLIVTVDLPATAIGDYHLEGPGTRADNAGTASFGGEDAFPEDFDDDLRPLGGGWDIGADEVVP